jgi:hypothetical protein
MDDLRWIGRWAIAKRCCATSYHWTRQFVFVVLSCALEKNPTKLLAIEAPVIFSAGRVVVLALAAAVVRRLWMPAPIGWPDATLGAVVAIALPVLEALRRVQPADVVALAKDVIERLGIGDVGAGSSGGSSSGGRAG